MVGAELLSLVSHIGWCYRQPTPVSMPTCDGKVKDVLLSTPRLTIHRVLASGNRDIAPVAHRQEHRSEQRGVLFERFCLDKPCRLRLKHRMYIRIKEELSRPMGQWAIRNNGLRFARKAPVWRITTATTMTWLKTLPASSIRTCVCGGFDVSARRSNKAPTE